MTVPTLFTWLERVFVKRPLVGIACALLMPIVAQATTDSAMIVNIILVVSWILLTFEVYRTLPNQTGTKILTTRLLVTALVSLLIGALLYTSLWRQGSQFTITYLGSELDGQEVTLTKSIDPTKRQLRMFIEPNLSSTFSIVGISARNEGSVPLEPDMTYLSFSGHVAKLEPYGGSWAPSPDRNLEGWTTFQSSFGRLSISPGHPLNVPDFIGTPIPNTTTKVRVAIVYGLKEARAEFTLKP